MNRPLTTAESELVRWMLEHGKPEAKSFLPQLEVAVATSWRCPCGCASINFIIQGRGEPSGGMNPLADFTFSAQDQVSGIFVFEQGGLLSGVEVYGLSGDAPRSLPSIESLQPVTF